MPYNPDIHHRRSIRLKGYDYSQAGWYFVTSCVQDRKCVFGKVENGEMLLNEYGKIADQQWAKLPERFANMVLDVWQIMPNHMHGIILMTDIVGATLAVAPDKNTDAQNDFGIATGAGASPAPTKTVGDIVGAYKSLVANDCLAIFKQNNPGKMMGKLWQRNYYEIIIHGEPSYQRISDYIVNNPGKWDNDKLFKK